MARLVLRIQRGGKLLGSWSLGDEPLEMTLHDLVTGEELGCFTATSPRGAVDELPVAGPERVQGDDLTMPLPEPTDIGEPLETTDGSAGQAARPKPAVPNLAQGLEQGPATQVSSAAPPAASPSRRPLPSTRDLTTREATEAEAEADQLPGYTDELSIEPQPEGLPGYTDELSIDLNPEDLPGFTDELSIPLDPDEEFGLTDELRPEEAYGLTDELRPDEAHGLTDELRPEEAHSLTDELPPEEAHSLTDELRPEEAHSITNASAEPDPVITTPFRRDSLEEPSDISLGEPLTDALKLVEPLPTEDVPRSGLSHDVVHPSVLPAEVWVLRDNAWRTGGALQPGQRATSRGGWVRLEADGRLTVVSGTRMSGSGTLVDGRTVELPHTDHPRGLPPGASVLLRDGNHGIYVRSEPLGAGRPQRGPRPVSRMR